MGVPGPRRVLPIEIGGRAGPGKGDRAVVILPDEIAEDAAVAVGMDGVILHHGLAAHGAQLFGIAGMFAGRGDDMRVKLMRLHGGQHLFAAVNARIFGLAGRVGVHCAVRGVAVRGDSDVAGHARAGEGLPLPGQHPGMPGGFGQGNRAVHVRQHREFMVAGAGEGYGVRRVALVARDGADARVVLAEGMHVFPHAALQHEAFARVRGIMDRRGDRHPVRDYAALHRGVRQPLEHDREAFARVKVDHVRHRNPAFAGRRAAHRAEQGARRGIRRVCRQVAVNFAGVGAGDRAPKGHIGQVFALFRGEHVRRGGAAQAVLANKPVIAVSVLPVAQRLHFIGAHLVDRGIVIGKPEITVAAPAGAPGVLDQPRAVVRGFVDEILAGEGIVPAHNGHGVVCCRAHNGAVIGAGRGPVAVPLVVVILVVAAVAELRRAEGRDRRLDRRWRFVEGMHGCHAQVPVEAVPEAEGALHLLEEGELIQRFVEPEAALQRRTLVVEHREARVNIVAAVVHNVGVRVLNAVVAGVRHVFGIAVQAVPHDVIFRKVHAVVRRKPLLDRVGFHHGSRGVRPAGAADLVLHRGDQPQRSRVPGRGEVRGQAGRGVIHGVRRFGRGGLAPVGGDPLEQRQTVDAGVGFGVIPGHAVCIGMPQAGQMIAFGDRPRGDGQGGVDHAAGRDRARFVQVCRRRGERGGAHGEQKQERQKTGCRLFYGFHKKSPFKVIFLYHLNDITSWCVLQAFRSRKSNPGSKYRFFVTPVFLCV